MSRLVLLIIGYSNLLYGNSPPPYCTEEDKETTKHIEDVYLFPKKNEATPIINDTTKYFFDGNEVDEGEVINLSQQYIECLPDFYENNPYDFDKPLPNGWLYPPPFKENSRYWKKYFDTGQNEYWVFPNVHCDEKRRLTAMSWMRSGTHESHNNNGAMHEKFKKNTPPFPTGNTSDGSIYCGWNGWLYPAEDDSYEKWVDTEDDEAFTLVNVYCRKNKVIYLHEKMGGNIDFAGKLKQPFKPTDTAPFKSTDTATLEGDNLVRCNWQGWLYKAMLLNDTWEDGNEKKRWTYERYFIISNNGIAEIKNSHAYQTAMVAACQD